jgi:MerR family redox-sensitive transcriptional activator SoxR
MQAFGIGEIAERAGIATSTIRYYERIGLLPAAKRVSGKRRYELSILEKIGVIRLAQDAGYTIAEIQTLLHEFPTDTPPSARWNALAENKIAELNKLIEQMQAMKRILEQTLQCQCPQLEDCAAVESSVLEKASTFSNC